MNVPFVLSYLPIELFCLCFSIPYVKVSLECYFKLENQRYDDTHPSPSLSRTSLNKMADPVEIVS